MASNDNAIRNLKNQYTPGKKRRGQNSESSKNHSELGIEKGEIQVANVVSKTSLNIWNESPQVTQAREDTQELQLYSNEEINRSLQLIAEL